MTTKKITPAHTAFEEIARQALALDVVQREKERSPALKLSILSEYVKELAARIEVLELQPLPRTRRRVADFDAIE
ncbi:hypothetical protein [Paraburkholderia sp. SIMBA_027]|uniref:hypothetical protein n=2 Tax=Pseudomonadati TaxID=3379134 RepID=UPI003978BCFD